jgi:hypothetical protein
VESYGIKNRLKQNQPSIGMIQLDRKNNERQCLNIDADQTKQPPLSYRMKIKSLSIKRMGGAGKHTTLMFHRFSIFERDGIRN